MPVILPMPDHRLAWADMRHALWPEVSRGEHLAEIDDMLARMADGDAAIIAFIALSAEGQAVGFAEASLRHDYVNGCDSSPVAFLEGIHVRPGFRRLGMARALIAAVEAWGRALGCMELGSDAEIANRDSHALHAARRDRTGRLLPQAVTLTAGVPGMAAC